MPLRRCNSDGNLPVGGKTAQKDFVGKRPPRGASPVSALRGREVKERGACESAGRPAGPDPASEQRRHKIHVSPVASPCAFSALVSPTARLDSTGKTVTTDCPHCGISTIYLVEQDAAEPEKREEGDSLSRSEHAQLHSVRDSVHSAETAEKPSPRRGREAPRLGVRGPGGASFGALPEPPPTAGKPPRGQRRGRGSAGFRAVRPSVSPLPSPPASPGSFSGQSGVAPSPRDPPTPPQLRSPPAVRRSGAARSAASEEEVESRSVFVFKGRDGADRDGPLFTHGKGSRTDGSPSADRWTLPPCEVTVPPRDRTWFWDEVWTKAEAVNGRSSARRPLQGRDGTSSSAIAARRDLIPVPLLSEQDSKDDDVPSDGLKAFPVIWEAGRRKHANLSWQAMVDLHDRVARHSLASSETMQFLRLIDTDVLPPYDIRCLGKALFQPVEYDLFESKWAQLAEKTAAQNLQARQDDPGYGVGPALLLGVGDFADVNRTVNYDPLVLEQCQKVGMTALVQMIEMSAPKQPFATIRQGTDEPFLKFAERLTASVERQVPDLSVREPFLQFVVRSNCNAECRKIIEALPGDPTLTQMADACMKMGTPGGKAVAMVATFRLPWKGQQGGKQTQANVQASKMKGKKGKKGTFPSFLCGRCGRPNHKAEECKATAHVNRQPLSGPGNAKHSAKGKRAQTQVRSQSPVPMEICWAKSQPAPAGQQA
uniref:Retroviral nucleocapsid Gag protein p24 C-terminal domain-containing protein n=1 Tax=Cyanoderma ruficeps TaxID=181631 RepID=A0A8C3QYW6_9PASS